MSRNIIIFSILLVVLIVAAYFMLNGRKTKTVVLHGHTITVELALTDPQQKKGLSGRTSMPLDKGMIFVFGKYGNYPFWMKDMRFPIDIIFLRDNKVTTIYHSVPPTISVNGVTQQNLTNYAPTAMSNRVLEVNAGLAKQYNLKQGDSIETNL